MANHSTPFVNKQIRKLLGKDINNFTLASIRGKPARTKNKIIVNGKNVIIYGSDFIAKGYLKIDNKLRLR